MGFAKSRPAAHSPRHTSQPDGPLPKARFTAPGLAARFTVHMPQSSLEFLPAVFYGACSDLCSKMEEGEFWFLCNFHRFNPLQSLYLFVAHCSRNKRYILTAYVCLFREPNSTVDVETMQV